MYGLFYRLLVFILVVWLARTVLSGLLRTFARNNSAPKVKEPPGDRPSDPARSKLNLSKDDVIDVDFTEVDPKRQNKS